MFDWGDKLICTRRQFLSGLAGSFLAGDAVVHSAEKKPDLAREVGITTSSLVPHLAAHPERDQFSLLELPKILRNELDMRVIDLNTDALASWEDSYLDRCREAAEKAGCVITNLKMNQLKWDMSSSDREVRAKALTEYKRTIDAAARLGARWARPLPTQQRPELEIHAASYRELADYAAARRIQMLVENFGWMDSDPQSVPKVVKAVGRNIAACPDTGNWTTNEVRYAGLAKTFPLAVTCDFKARELGPAGEHALYDLRRCFQIGWDAGFRGPWCLEHAHRDRKQLFQELALLRDMLRQWMAAGK